MYGFKLKIRDYGEELAHNDDMNVVKYGILFYCNCVA